MAARKNIPAEAGDKALTRENFEEIRRELERKIQAFLAEPRLCRRRACRRARQCQPPPDGCLSLREGPEMTPEQERASWEKFKRQIVRRAKELGVA